MEAGEFRAAFASFAGSDRFCRFVRALNGQGRWRGRFLYWQEELLARFVVSIPSADAAFERVEPLLRVCELHGRTGHRPRGFVAEVPWRGHGSHPRSSRAVPEHRLRAGRRWAAGSTTSAPQGLVVLSRLPGGRGRTTGLQGRSNRAARQM